jgi:hypothetical protein
VQEVLVRASLSISADGRLIEYLANPHKVISSSEGQTLDNVNGVGLLPTSSPPGSAVRNGRTVLHWSGRPFGSAAVTDDGRTIYYCAPAKRRVLAPSALSNCRLTTSPPA